MLGTHCRRPPLASYMCTEGMYGLYYTLKSKGLIKSFPNGEVRNTAYVYVSECVYILHAPVKLPKGRYLGP